VRAGDQFKIEDSAGEPLPIDRPPASAAGAEEVVHLLEHLTVYRNILRIRNQAAAPALHGALAITEITPDQRDGRQYLAGAGKRIAFRLYNQSRSAIYITVLQLNANYAVRRVYPDSAFTQKIAAGNKTPSISAIVDSAAQQGERIIFKIFVTSAPTSFDSLCLPPLQAQALPVDQPVRAGSPLAWLLTAVRHPATRRLRPVAAGTDDQWIVEQVEFVVGAGK
jgi:hypothetical protein